MRYVTIVDVRRLKVNKHTFYIAHDMYQVRHSVSDLTAGSAIWQEMALPKVQNAPKLSLRTA